MVVRSGRSKVMTFLRTWLVFVLWVSRVTPGAGQDEGEMETTPKDRYVVKRGLGQNCEGYSVCDSKQLMLECVYKGGHGTCFCNDKVAIQVDFLGYAIAKTCLVRHNVVCTQRTRAFNYDVDFKPEVDRLEQIVQNASSGSSVVNEEIGELMSLMASKYATDMEKRPFEAFVTEYFRNFTRDAKNYIDPDDDHQDQRCASGKCNQTARLQNGDGAALCTRGVDPIHRISNPQRKFRNTAKKLLFHKTFFSIFYFLHSTF